jgi:VanZ family protein
VAFGVALVAQLIAVYAPRVPAGPPVNGLDKVVHVVIFALPVLAGLMAGVRVLWVLAVFALHAPASELIQHFALPHRSGDVFDVLADLAGVALGGLAYLVWSRRQP